MSTTTTTADTWTKRALALDIEGLPADIDPGALQEAQRVLKATSRKRLPKEQFKILNEALTYQSSGDKDHQSLAGELETVQGSEEKGTGNGAAKKEKWLECPTEWCKWSIENTGEPKPRDPRDYLRSLGLDPKAQAEEVWHREVARTCYYKDKFWYLNDTGKWYAYPKVDLLNILEGTELFRNRPAGKEAGAAWARLKANAFLRRIQTKNVADFVGELPGYMLGLHHHKGRTFLIVNEPELIKPLPGDYGVVLELLHEVLGEEQTEYLLGWLKLSDRHLRSGKKSSGQMLIIGGKKDSGKTFIKEHIIRPILGGRQADPSDYLRDGKFNSDVFKAESWEIDDSVGTKEKRQILTGASKKMTATSEHRIEGKYAEALQSPPVFIRIHAYVNTDSENDLFAIPEAVDSIKDKLIILHASQSKHERQATILPDANVEGAQEEFVERIRKARPAFTHYIQNREIPEKYQDSRFGPAPYINPELAKVMHKASDEGKLLDLIDKLVFTFENRAEPWEGTSSELDLLLSVNAKDASQTKDLDRVKWKGDAIGNGLWLLSKHPGGRVTKRERQERSRGWIIQPPEGHAEYLKTKPKKQGTPFKVAA